MLKRHILRRLEGMLQHEKSLVATSALASGEPAIPVLASLDGLFFKHNRMYTHNILRVNYTTYDVRRAQDTINPKTTHCNAIFLAEDDGDDPNAMDSHPFLYGRILGIYHVNVVYSGPGMLDYKPRRVEFLWVRWYEHLEDSGSWAACTLDRLCFPPISKDGAFGFVDPADVVRGCHVIPRFATGLRWPKDQNRPAMRSIKVLKGRDEDDWKEYCVNRYLSFERGVKLTELVPNGTGL